MSVMKISQRIKLNSLYSRQVVKKIRYLGVADEEINYLINNFELIKSICQGDFGYNLPYVLYLFNKFDLFNVDIILKTIQELNLGTSALLTEGAEDILIRRLKKREPISMAGFKKLKDIYPELFLDEYTPYIKEIIIKIIETEEILSTKESISLLKLDSKFPVFSKKIFSDTVNRAIDLVGIDKVREIIKNTTSEEHSEYYLLWVINRANENKDNQLEIDKYILGKLGINIAPELILKNPNYQGLPFDIKSSITDEQINTDIFELDYLKYGNYEDYYKFAKSISTDLIKTLYNYLTVGEIKDFIRTAYSNLYLLDLNAKRSQEQHQLFLHNDATNNLSSAADLLLTGNLNGILAVVKQADDIVKIYECLYYVAMFGKTDKHDNYNKIIELMPTFNDISDLKKEYLVTNCYFSINEWLKVYNGEELDINFVEALPVTMANIAKQKQGEYQRFINSEIIKSFFAERQDTYLEYSRALLGSAITFGFFENESNSLDNAMACFSFFINNNEQLNKFKTVFSRISVGIDQGFLLDLRENYKLLAAYSSKELETMFNNLREAQAYNSFLKFKTVQELIDYSVLNYNGVNPSFAYAAGLMKTFGVLREDYDKVEKPFEVGVEREFSSLPYISGQVDNLTFKTIKLSDSYLMYFDLKNNIKNFSETEKAKVLTSNNIRIIEINDESGKTIDILEVKRTADNQIILASLMGNQLSQRLGEKIIAAYQEKLKAGDSIASAALTDDISKYNDEYTGNNQYNDEPDVISNRRLTEPEYEKVKKIVEVAFKANYEANMIPGVLANINDLTNNNSIIIGRDWVIIYNPKEKGLHLELIVRFNRNDNKDSLGRKEMRATLNNIIKSTTEVIDVAAMSTSYYTFAKMAMNGEILILKDKFVKANIADNPMFTTTETVNNYCDENDQINFDFANGEINIINYPNYSMESIQTINYVKFISAAQELSPDQLQKLEIQKKIYSQVVERIERAREKDRQANHEGRLKDDELYQNMSYEELATQPSLAGIKNLRLYSIKYLRYLANRYTLIKTNGPGYVPISATRAR